MPDIDAVAAALEEFRLAEARLERRREAANEPSALERSILRCVFERWDAGDPVTPSELAEHVGLTRPGISVELRRLQAQGLIRMEPHPADGRSKIILPISRNDHLDGDDELTDRIRDVAKRLSREHAAAFIDFLEELREVVDRAQPIPHAVARGEEAAGEALS